MRIKPTPGSLRLGLARARWIGRSAGFIMALYGAASTAPPGLRVMANRTVEKPPTKIKPETMPKTARPPLYKVILINDDYTPREFVVKVLEAVFRMNESQAYRVMMTAHQRGACVIAVYTRDVAETKAKEATDLGKSQGYPLFFTTEPEE
jgi:ATP-dependent Clp protease adaptor protein ClpS